MINLQILQKHGRAVHTVRMGVLHSIRRFTHQIVTNKIEVGGGTAPTEMRRRGCDVRVGQSWLRSDNEG